MIKYLIYKNEPGGNSSLEQEEIEDLLLFVREGIAIQVFGKNSRICLYLWRTKPLLGTRPNNASAVL